MFLVYKYLNFIFGYNTMCRHKYYRKNKSVILKFAMKQQDLNAMLRLWDRSPFIVSVVIAYGARRHTTHLLTASNLHCLSLK